MKEREALLAQVASARAENTAISDKIKIVRKFIL